MSRHPIKLPKHGRDRDFTWRGEEISRLEALSDAVFAFAITLLVVSLSVPESFNELVNTMKGFAAFAVTFTAIIAIWYSHYLFFRRYGLTDAVTVVLNSALLLVVLFYIYPLKFLANLLINVGLLGMVFGVSYQSSVAFSAGDWPVLMIVYSLGFLAIFLIFFLLYLHAYRLRGELQLNPLETLLTKYSMVSQAIMMTFAAASIAIVAIGGAQYALFSGIIYWLIGPVMWWVGSRARNKIERVKFELTSDSGSAELQ